MINILLWSLLLITSVKCDLKCKKDEPCPQIPKHYQELGCTQVLTDSECCPYFECPNLKNLEHDKCYYRNESFGIGEKLPVEKLSGLCSAECFCEK